MRVTQIAMSSLKCEVFSNFTTALSFLALRCNDDALLYIVESVIATAVD